MTEVPNFYLFGGTKLPENQAPEAHIQHTSKSSSNDYVNQDLCETVETSWMLKICNSDLFGALMVGASLEIKVTGFH